jgi:hypothetical protein
MRAGIALREVRREYLDLPRDLPAAPDHDAIGYISNRI